MNLQNQLTMLRIILIPVFIVVLMLGHYYWAAAIFVVAAATDALDGHIARKYNLITNFGKLMDPLADKLLVVSALVCLVELGDIQAWI
ncbi:MAG: CDP-alcohol phosphatidyltransferase family protein, partial [Anaerovorax sp.]